MGSSLALLALLSFALVGAQPTAVLQIEARSGGLPLPDASVVVNGATHAAAADGSLTVTLPAGRIEITVAKDGFVPATTTVTLQPGQTQRIVIDVEPQPTIEEAVTVFATRTDQRLEDQPTRVEVLDREEVEEKMLMTPGDIVMMLNEMGGMRVQATSPSLGAASVRVQGMRGRYTRFFSDGLPLYGDVGGLGLLQIPPMDLGRVEVVKGVASSLYGAGAMGGVVNLISRRPGARAERELLVNRSTRGATDAVAWLSSPARQGWAFTLIGGGHWQQRTDVDDDGWADLPGYSRGVIRPRAFWDGGNGRTFFATTGFTSEERRGGGTVAGAPYPETLTTGRVDAGAVGQLLLRQRYLLSARASAVHQRHAHQFGDVRERDAHDTLFGEVTLRAPAGRHTLVAGAAFERDAYRPKDVPQFDYSFSVPGVFVQDDVAVATWLSLSASARLDAHDTYGSFLSPRFSALLRAGSWSSRVSIGSGFYAPSPLTEETEAAGLTRLEVPRPLRAERGRSVSFDLTRTDGPLSYTATVFGSRVRQPLHASRSARYELSNLAEASTAVGVELLGTMRLEALAVTTTYAFVDARDSGDGSRRQTPLTPRHSAGAVMMWEREEAGRVGLEIYYTGVQRLDENPFRETSRPYVSVGLLVERQLGRIRLFVNGENLTDVRQTRWDPLIRPTRAVDGRWTVDAWAPLDGRNINGGVRLGF